MADTPEHHVARPAQTRDHNPYNNRDSSIPEGNKLPVRNNTFPSKQLATGGGSYEMEDLYLRKDPEAGKSVKQRGVFDGEFMNRPICNMRMKNFIILVVCLVLGAVAAALAGIFASEKAIEDHKVTLAGMAAERSRSVASVFAATATAASPSPTA